MSIEPGRVKPPIVVTISQILAVLWTIRCLVRLAFALETRRYILLYGSLAGPVLFDLVIALICIFCLTRSRRRTPAGLLANGIPILIAFLLIVFSAESWTLWHWISYGGPAEPPWLPRDFSYQFTYRTYEAVLGACIFTFIEEFVLGMALLRLFFSAASGEYFGFQWRSPFRRTSVMRGLDRDH